MHGDVKHDLVAKWLGLAPGAWPPDHYALLGLHPGEADPRRIEESVHQRLLRLRPYQLNHPEQVTEAMNRLARAYSCLTNAEAKRRYDANMFAPGGTAVETGEAEPAADAVDPLAWLFGPWSRLAVQAQGPRATVPETRMADWIKAPPPKRVTPVADHGLADTSTEGSTDDSAASAGTVEAPPTEPAQSPRDPVVEAARSPEACHGLWTRGALYRRARATRGLFSAWQGAGQYLNVPDWRPRRAEEAKDLIRRLRRIHDAVEEFPRVLGEPGQPGFWVLSLAQQEVVIPIFRALDAGQREALARDWRDVRRLLSAHRRFLCGEIHAVQGQSWPGRVQRTLAAPLREHPNLWRIFLLVVLAGLLWVALILLQANLGQ
jgi:hypothetical protein